jgi:hypothetical protein
MLRRGVVQWVDTVQHFTNGLTDACTMSSWIISSMRLIASALRHFELLAQRGDPRAFFIAECLDEQILKARLSESPRRPKWQKPLQLLNWMYVNEIL